MAIKMNELAIKVHVIHLGHLGSKMIIIGLC